jgi:F0F1-type ATP synthase membrane subunit b/b'
VSPALTTFLFEAANFLILAGVVGWFAFHPVRRALEQRRAEQLRQAQDAARQLAEARQLKQEIAERRDGLQQELDALRAHARSAAEQQAADIRAAARSAADQERVTAAERLVELQRQQVDRLAATVAATTRNSIELLLKQIDGPDLEQSLVTAACRQLPELVRDGNGEVAVESAAPLTGEFRKQIEAALGPPSTHVTYRVRPELGAGVRVQTNAGLVDVSAGALARFAEQKLLQEFAAESAEPVPEADRTSPTAAAVATPP